MPHVLMRSGRANPRVHVFYEGLGFVPGLPFAYIAERLPTRSNRFPPSSNSRRVRLERVVRSCSSCAICPTTIILYNVSY